MMHKSNRASFRMTLSMVLLAMATVTTCFPIADLTTESSIGTSTLAPSAAEAEKFVADFLHAELKALLSSDQTGETSANNLQAVPFARYRRGVSLGSLRKVANNVALSEYYRIRGLDALSSLSVPDALGGAVDGSPDDDATLQKSKIFKKLFDTIRRDKTLGNIFGYLQP